MGGIGGLRRNLQEEGSSLVKGEDEDGEKSDSRQHGLYFRKKGKRGKGSPFLSGTIFGGGEEMKEKT